MEKDTRKTVLITGCSEGGIGHEFALAFHAKGARVFATARRLDSLPKLEALGIETIYLDVSSVDSINEVRDDIIKRTGGKLDFLINNAGRNYTVPALDLDLVEVRNVFDTNVIGVMAMCQAFAPLLINARGTIVQIGSVASLMPYVFGSVYNATKAAIRSFSDTLRVELAPFGVKVKVIITGGVKSCIARIDRVLADESLYRPCEADYERRVKHSQEGAMDTTAYAQTVVHKLWKDTDEFEVWAGSKIWRVWFMVAVLGKRVQNYIFTKMFNLWKLKQI